LQIIQPFFVCLTCDETYDMDVECCGYHGEYICGGALFHSTH
jgi:hypothetical protein